MGGCTIHADFVVNGDIIIKDNLLTIGSIAIKKGVVTLGDPERRTGGGLNATTAGIHFYSGATLQTVGGVNSVILTKKEGALTFHPGSFLDITGGSLVINHGRLIAHGTLRPGCLKNDPFLLNYVGVDSGQGRVVLGDSFCVAVTDSLEMPYRENPEDIVENAVLIDAIVTRFTYTFGELWRQDVETDCGVFTFAARLGVEPSLGGGLRLRFTKK